jgi:hypothetical protein
VKVNKTQPGPRQASEAGESAARLEASSAEMEAEHQALAAALSDLVSVTDVTLLAPALERLADLLAAHFASEERAGGLYECVSARSPRLRERTRGLVEDHHRILSTVRALSKQASEGGGPEVLGKARGLTLILAEHEGREQDLVASGRRA